MEKDNNFELMQDLQDVISPLKENLHKISDGIREMTERLFTPEVKEAMNSIAKIMDDNRASHKTITEEFENYFKSKGIIYTKDTEEFIDWFYKIYCEGANDGMFDIVSEHHFKLYHEYKERLFNGGWSDEKEREYLNFDSNDTTNPLIFDMNLITGLHNNFRSYIFETTDIDTFKNCFRERPMKINKREGITISELCYLFGKIESKQTGVSNFAEWMKNHIEGNNYGSKKNELIDLAKNAKEKRNGFSLTAPQQKALENKDKIDKLFNRMHPD